jgi:predicted PurR-regulated permease PerM
MSEKISRTHLRTFLGLLLGCLAVIFWMIGPYLLALFLGGTLAMLTYPVYKWLRIKKYGPRTAAMAVTLFLLVLVIVPIAGFSIMAVRQGMIVIQSLPDLTALSPQTLTASLSRFELVKTIIGDPAHVSVQLKSALYALGQYITAGIFSLARGIPQFMLQIALAVIACFFFLMDGKRFVNWMLGLSALNTTVQEKLIESFQGTAVSTILASLISASCQAVFGAVCFISLGVPGAFLAGGAMFLFSWLPVVGGAPIWLAGIGYLYMQGSIGKLIIMLIIGTLTSMTDNIIRALMLRGQVAMHPLVGLVAVFGGINMFGILGIFIGPILAAMLISLLKLWPELRDRFGLEEKTARETN